MRRDERVTGEMVMAHAKADAAFAGTEFIALGRADRTRYLERSRRCLTAALEVEQPVAVEEWQPIETAPKSNGSETFLAFIPGHGMCVCACTVLGNVYSVASNRTITKATHWRPLPTPPSSPRISASSAEAGGSATVSIGGDHG